MKRRREITIEFEREIVIMHHQSNRSWCYGCKKRVEMLSAEEAATIMRTIVQSIYDLVDERQVHFTISTDGNLLVCPDSLLYLRSDMRASAVEK